MSFPGFEPSAVARALGALPEGPGELADGYFERSSELRLTDGPYGRRDRVEEGLCLRLTSAGTAYLAIRDALDEAAFRSAYRQVARTLPSTPMVWRRLPESPDDESADDDLAQAPRRLRRALEDRGVAFRYRADFVLHRREVLVAASSFSEEVQRERFYSVRLELPGSSWGTLAPDLDRTTIEGIADLAAETARYVDCAPASVAPTTLVLGPHAAAVFLHEAVAHTLEVDTLAASGDPRAALGVQLASSELTVFDDPGTAPTGVRRTSDDEGMPVVRRSLLRRGRVETLIADRLWSERVDGLIPGAGRRADRSSLPGPRSFHLEVAAGDASPRDLIGGIESGLYVPLFVRGQLDALRGTCRLDAPGALEIRSGKIGARVGRCRVEAPAADLLGAVVTVGSDAQVGGAGWCAKSDQKLAVWATTPTLVLDGVAARPW